MSLPELAVLRSKRIFLDITTSARWAGPPVGIVRTEREIAKRGPQNLGSALEFVFWDAQEETCQVLDASTAESLLSGDLTVSHPLALNDYASRTETPEAGDTLATIGLDWEEPSRLRSVFRAKQRRGFSYAAVVHDLCPIQHPHFSPASYRERLIECLGEMMWTCDALLCTSQTIRKELIRYRESSGLPCIEPIVFPLGTELANCIRRLPSELAGFQFALLVSTLEPRKNHRAAYQAWDAAIMQGAIDPTITRLVFLGRKGWGSDDLLREIKANPRTRESIVLIEGADDATLASLYSAAAFCIYPSLYEGFGLPVAEALAYGKVVMAAKIDALIETGASLAQYIDPLDVSAWARQLARGFHEPRWRAKVERRVKRLNRPMSWDVAAQVFYSALDPQVR
jgi:glycosyltransferase involved in cell wall biosynthesis